MKRAADIIVLIAWGVVVHVVWLWDAIVEARKKARLGSLYEGPAED